jgi:integrase
LQIEKFYADLLRGGGRDGKPLSAKTVRNSHVVLRKALSDAERLGLVQRNAAATAKPPSFTRPEFATWSSEDLREFFTGIRGERIYPALVVLATTGMRRGEVLGLRWSDLDLDAGQLAIVQTLTAVNGEAVIGPTKTSRSRRTVYVDPQTVSVLREHRKRQREERLVAGPAWDTTTDLVFRDQAGGLAHPDWFSREFRRVVAASGSTPIRLHDLRHTYATLALKAGVHPKVVSERLGHATVGITLDLYSHVTPAIARDAANVVADRIFE